MTQRITRRRFLQMGGLTGTAVACQRLHNQSPPRVPHALRRAKKVRARTSGTPALAAECPAGCGTIVRVSNGRARRIEGNPPAPAEPREALCSRASRLQVPYNPDRLQNAVRQDTRGSLKFVPLEWEPALSQVAERLKSARLGSVAFYSSLISDSLATDRGAVRDNAELPRTRFLRQLGPLRRPRHIRTRHRTKYSGLSLGCPLRRGRQRRGLLVRRHPRNETWLSPVAKEHGIDRNRAILELLESGYTNITGEHPYTLNQKRSFEEYHELRTAMEKVQQSLENLAGEVRSSTISWRSSGTGR